MLRAFCELYGKADNAFRRIKYVHFVKEGEFDEIKSFRDEIEASYGIKVELFSSDFKGEVQRLIDENEIKVILMGNRRTDPWSKDLTPICASSAGWPSFTRVFPILDWNYHEVWHYLLSNHLSFCSLYNDGYTSLGEKVNTVKNPHLKIEGSEDDYLPAFKLDKDE